MIRWPALLLLVPGLVFAGPARIVGVCDGFKLRADRHEPGVLLVQCPQGCTQTRIVGLCGGKSVDVVWRAGNAYIACDRQAALMLTSQPPKQVFRVQECML